MKGKEEGGTGISKGWQGSFEGIPEKLPCQPEEIPVPPDSFPFIFIVSYKGGMKNSVQSLGTVLVLPPTLGGTVLDLPSHLKFAHHTFVGNNQNKRKRVGRYWDFLRLARQLIGNSLEAALPALGIPSTSLLFSFH